MEQTTRYSKIYEQLAAIVGPQYVSDRETERYLYSSDFITSSTRPCRCDFVVMPETTKEVQQIVQLANRNKIPVVPTVSMLSVGNVAAPLEGGILIDLRRMNRVLEVDEDDMYALVEGGITWADLKGYLDKHHPDLRMSGIMSSPGQGVVPCMIEYGMFNTSFLFGTGNEMLNGLEVVLPTGEVIRTGSTMISPYWFGRHPLPDITGLFVGWEGTTGIVTKAAIKLWPKQGRSDWMISMDTWKTGFVFAKHLIRAHLGIHNFEGVNHAFTIMMTGFENIEKKVPPYADYAEKNGIPDCHFNISLGAYTKKEMEAKVEALTDISKEHGAQIKTQEAIFNTLPVGQRSMAFALNPPAHQWTHWYTYKGGGHEWCGFIGPIHKGFEFFHRGREIAWKKYGKHTCWAYRALFGGHRHMLRHLLPFNKNDPEDTKKNAMLNRDLTKLGLELGLVRYKPPHWAKTMEMEKMHPGSADLLRKIKNLLDPNKIMNPGH